MPCSIAITGLYRISQIDLDPGSQLHGAQKTRHGSRQVQMADFPNVANSGSWRRSGSPASRNVTLTPSRMGFAF